VKAALIKISYTLALIGISAIWIPIRSQFFGVISSLLLMALLLFWDDLPPKE